MKILFITFEHPANKYGGLGTFTYEFVTELKKQAKVIVVYIHFSNQPLPNPHQIVDYNVIPELSYLANNIESKTLETAASIRSQVQPIIDNFKPDIIHCNDRQTFLPFRYDKNVFFSSHLLFSDLISIQNINEQLMNVIAIDRCSLTKSSMVGVYSRFAANRVLKLIPESNPIVLPLGINTKNFYSNKSNTIIKISYFGRFDKNQKGLDLYLDAINYLGHSFMNKYNVEFRLYGKGILSDKVDLSLITEKGFLEDKELFKAYAETDIVVMPSYYEPFGLVGIEAMASECILLAPSGLGMDEYTKPGITSVEIPHNSIGIAEKITEVVLNIDQYQSMKQLAKKSAQLWTWKRSVNAHMFFYKQLLVHNFKIKNVYNKSFYYFLERAKEYDTKSEFYETIEKVYNNITSTEKILFLVHGYQKITHPKNNISIICINEVNSIGVIQRIELLSLICTEIFNKIYIIGPWDTVLNPIQALHELSHLAFDKMYIWYRIGKVVPWQTIQIEGENDWNELIQASNINWKFSISLDHYNLNNKNYNICFLKKQNTSD